MRSSRLWVFTLALTLGTTGVSAAAGFDATLQQSQSTPSFIRELVAARTIDDPVLAFYAARDYRPAWGGGIVDEEMAREVRAALERADEEGLNDSDYALPASDDALPSYGEKAAAYDVAFSAAVLRYAHDVRQGRVKPEAVYDDIKLPPSNFDAAAALNEALAHDSVTAFLINLPPPQPEYRRLAQTLMQYRAIAKAGGWPIIPSGITLDGHDPRLPLLVKRLAAEDDLVAWNPDPSVYDIGDAIKRFQERNGLPDDGAIGPATLAALNVPAEARVKEIEANMERWRWMPRRLEDRYIAVNVPDQSLQYIHNGVPVLASKVVVGRNANPTPITRATVNAVIANPPWDIPGFIAARDLLPLLRRNANTLAAKNMVVMNGPPGDPYGRQIDWAHVDAATFPYAIQQLPGPEAALGVLMLDSPNDFDVYLHDTPNKKIFASAERGISNGCIRVDAIGPLASLALTGDERDGAEEIVHAVASGQTTRLPLAEPLPVYFLYWTAVVGDDGRVGFRADRYGRDKTLIAALDKTGGARVAGETRPTTTLANADLSP